MPCFSNRPFSMPTKNGSERAVGKVLRRTSVSSAAAGELAHRARAAAAKRVGFTGRALWMAAEAVYR
jgi:hypothetical protein